MLAGPSGVGKGTIVDSCSARRPDLWVVGVVHDPGPRPSEVDGVDYHFVTRDEFEALRDAGGFLEWFEVFGDLKGTPRGPVEEHLAAGGDVLLEIDVQGALTVKREFPDALLVFVKPPVARGAAAAPRVPGHRDAGRPRAAPGRGRRRGGPGRRIRRGGRERRPGAGRGGGGWYPCGFPRLTPDEPGDA